MRVDFKNQCTQCKDMNKCRQHCALHAGKALFEYLNNVDTVETNIGDYKESVSTGKKDLVVSGHQIYSTGTPSSLLTSINTVLDASPKIKGEFNKTASAMIRMYCEYMKISKEEQQKLIDKLSNINKNRELILPFKLDTECSVENHKKGVKEDNICVISNIKWQTSKENYKLQCTIAFKQKQPTDDTIRYNIKDYLDKFRVEAYTINKKESKKVREIISITDYGIIKPIEFRNKEDTIVIDGTYVYSVLNSAVHIIGEWKDNKINWNTRANRKIADFIDKNIEVIYKHRRYIAPFMLHESNIIEL